ncbi:MULTISPECIES: EVE domain-containing protein [unclassified Sphingomonas]|jgi:predicted RNA-binding protein with PUA-like domain|uniref:EVE domain-containing protein n=1 Tax=unclassified Sphingomonas TaxID=196159 RepID=UPI000831CAB4|nr:MULTISPECIES: EVE domain-containing protein [unclassified Sphingomonas]MCH4891752.1 EVE domain-containing protein [Sphingomonas sp. SFZ2018-12]
MAYWLMKSEPDTYGWDDLVRDGETRWDGVRNNAARLHLRAMQPGDQAFFYHSGGDKAVVGIMEVSGGPHPDPADADWVAVMVRPIRPVTPPVTLARMKAAAGLADMAMLRQSRLSVSPVTPAQWALIMALDTSDTSKSVV